MKKLLIITIISTLIAPQCFGMESARRWLAPMICCCQQAPAEPAARQVAVAPRIIEAKVINEGPQCIICLDTRQFDVEHPEDTQLVNAPNCPHKFHQACLNEWYKKRREEGRHKTCPYNCQQHPILVPPIIMPAPQIPVAHIPHNQLHRSSITPEISCCDNARICAQICCQEPAACLCDYTYKEFCCTPDNDTALNRCASYFLCPVALLWQCASHDLSVPGFFLPAICGSCGPNPEREFDHTFIRIVRSIACLSFSPPITYIIVTAL